MYYLLHNPVAVVVIVVPPRPASLFSRSESAGPAAVPVALCVFQRGSASYNQPKVPYLQVHVVRATEDT